MLINKMSLCVGITFFLLLISQTKSQIGDIDINSFLALLFNTTEDQIIQVARNFQFIQVPQNTVKFISYLQSNETVFITSENYTQVVNIQSPIIFISHGWLGSGLAAWISQMAFRLHQYKACNVIAIDWSTWSQNEYIIASSTVQSVGFWVGTFIQVLFNQDQSVLGRIQVIGHSLGGHVAGFTGKRVFVLTNQSLDRVTALDAAGPLFELFPIKRPASLRLIRTDADFVDLVHTDKYLLGVADSYGKCDFFVNGGGPIQPGCRRVGTFIDQVICSHLSAHEYFTGSIYEPVLYKATACRGYNAFRLGLCNNNNQVVMGETVSRQATGDYYIAINISFVGNDYVQIET